jgi:hypothetical protein
LSPGQAFTVPVRVAGIRARVEINTFGIVSDSAAEQKSPPQRRSQIRPALELGDTTSSSGQLAVEMDPMMSEKGHFGRFAAVRGGSRIGRARVSGEIAG